MKTISLTQGQFTIVDDEDFIQFGALKWHVQRAIDGMFYAIRKKNGEHVRLHREIMGVPPTSISGKRVTVDHINHDSLDNRRSNLRVCTDGQNCKNRDQSKCHSSSGIVGVHKNAASGKWVARLGVDWGKVYIGSFDNKEDAGKAIQEARHKYHGEYASCR